MKEERLNDPAIIGCFGRLAPLKQDQHLKGLMLMHVATHLWAQGLHIDTEPANDFW